MSIMGRWIKSKRSVKGKSLVTNQVTTRLNFWGVSMSACLPRPIIVISWNCQGLGHLSVAHSLCDLVWFHKPDILFSVKLFVMVTVLKKFVF